MTNDRRARNYCAAAGIVVFDLIDMLCALWRLDILTRPEVDQLTVEIETRESMVIRYRERIFEE